MRREVILGDNMHDQKLGINTPIYPSITFAFDDPRAITSAFMDGLPPETHLYGRFGHPNYHDLCERLALMEGGESATLFASGMSATFTAFFAVVEVGAHVVVSSRIYGGTRGQLAMLAQKFSLKVDVVDVTDNEAFARACNKRTKLIFMETESNPETAVADITALDRIRRKRSPGALFIVDNTFSPLIARPLQLGADVVMHSATKLLSGRSDLMGGALIGSKEFIDGLTHPLHGEHSLIGALMHYGVAQEVAERFYQLTDRVRTSSARASMLAHLSEVAGLDVCYPLTRTDIPDGVLDRLDGEKKGGGVFSIRFISEERGIDFVQAVTKKIINDPLLGDMQLAHSMVSLGSAHTYVWCTTEAHAQSKATKWKPLPFEPIPLGNVRIAVGYAGEHGPVIDGFTEVFRELGYLT